MLFLHYVPKNALQNGTTNTREWRQSFCTSVWYSKRQNFRINPYFIMHIFLLKAINQYITSLGLNTLFFRTPAKIMLPPQAQTVQYRFLRRSRRLYENQKPPLSWPSSGSLQNNFETIGTIRTIIWKPGLSHNRVFLT